MKQEIIVKDDDFVKVDYKTINRLNQLEITNGKEIMLFCKIMSLSHNPDKACTASNEYLSKFLCTTDRNIRKYLEDLKEKQLIKTYEQKEGMKTTIRYIYPQYKTLKIAEEEMFRSSDGGEEQMGMSSGTNGSEERNKKVKPEEETFHHIIYNKREEENIDASLDDGAKAPKELVKILRDHKLTQKQLGNYKTVPINDKVKNEHMYNSTHYIDDNGTLKDILDCAACNGVSKDYACSYLANIIA